MKAKLATLALITVTAQSLAPQPALAGDRGLAALGGFVGGVLVGSAISSNHYDNYATAPAVVVNDRGYFADRCDDFGNRFDDRVNSGYWKVVSVRIWVPGYWVVERDRSGRSFRHYSAGHNEYRTDRRWVAHDRRDRPDRNYSYGYGRR